ncbi:MAG: sigma-70 family RNA polymerase sigma factor [Acidobacteriota bacterium]|nr:sigma-70 family RNA polymerase sigma factor [Acidobacteriota bacterium]
MTAQTVALKNLREFADSELIATSLAGREDSFEELVRRYQRPITAYVYRMTNDYDAALDVSQEIFIKVYNSLSRYKTEFKFSTWIYKIAHNAAIDYLRRNSNGECSLDLEIEDETFERPIESNLASPEVERERSEWRGEIQRVVQKLPPAYRELILLRHSQDLSYDEIAEIMNLPLGTVKNRLFRARELMRDLLVERGITGV